MPDSDRNIWFRPMKYGIGWGAPATWQGWLVLLAYLALVGAGVPFLQHSPILIIPFVLYVMLLSGILLFICWKKGAKPELRWGKKL